MILRFQSKDFASIEGAGFGFQNRRPGTKSWGYQGRIRHRDWEGEYSCEWDQGQGSHLLWEASGDSRLFGLAAALMRKGISVEIAQS